MKCVKIIPKSLKGSIETPPSKSISHRAIICAGLANGISKVENIEFSKDIEATLEGMKALGIKLLETKENSDTGRHSLTIEGGFPLKVMQDQIDCNESGSTLRFFIPIAVLLNKNITFTGRGKLVERPLDVYYEIFDRQGIFYETNQGKLPLKVKGKLKPGIFPVQGDISSQFISGLMLALPLLDASSKIVMTTPLESRRYVDLTIEVLKKFGIDVKKEKDSSFLIKGSQTYKNGFYRIEGDYSQAAFWMVAGILGGDINCMDLKKNSLQADQAIVDIITKMSGNIQNTFQGIRTIKSDTKAMVIDASQCPDIVPIVTVLGALSNGTTKITNAERLRIKESDRLKAIATELNKLGANIKELKDGLIIEGRKKLRGGVVESWNDHRIAMSLAIAAIRCEQPVTIVNSDAVNKSYPKFWEDYQKLGGQVEEIFMD
ncbi:3-phosphoshikimate 1-carboxyvinyltransferase [Garciella nitratireducens]|uniref:3-phosphoshikimate 1-carboxyvinyltransferase n=1 Tax=Garciella nitratireducens TaxID=218205 RepID=UPI000DEB8396|nr:3-phosphoshikimate 1-carboxyvinyltransferase [Garciella nitratireducens]RBP42704.1 3-phosphoshikimate 1-carboxyvinyltransferase [Garciella nitratireducens]